MITIFIFLSYWKKSEVTHKTDVRDEGSGTSYIIQSVHLLEQNYLFQCIFWCFVEPNFFNWITYLVVYEADFYTKSIFYIYIDSTWHFSVFNTFGLMDHKRLICCAYRDIWLFHSPWHNLIQSYPSALLKMSFSGWSS